jgi:hypothetical protein
VEGTDISGRLTIACSGQLNPSGRQAATSINLVGDLTYHAKDGTVAVGLIAQNNVKIPMYAPMGKSGTLSTLSMEVDCALIAQQGAEFVNFDASGSSSGWGPHPLGRHTGAHRRSLDRATTPASPRGPTPTTASSCTTHRRTFPR